MAYRGEKFEIPLGTEGLTGTSNPTEVAPGYLSEARNCSLAEGNIQKEGGADKYNATAITGGPTILGGWQHHTNSLAQRMVIAASDGKLYKDSGSGTFSVTLKSGLSGSMRPFFMEGGKEEAASDRKTFIFTGTNVVQVFADDDATTTDIATPPADWSGANQPTFGLIHNFRLLAGGNSNDPHRIYYSTTGDQEDFTSSGAGSVSVYPGEGEGLVGGISFNNYAIVFKRPKGIYAIDMRSATAANWTVQRLSSAIGLASPWAVVQTDTDVIFIDCTAGIQSLTNSLSNADVEGRNIGQQSFIEPAFRAQVNYSRLNNVRGVYYVAKREVHFAFTSASNTINDRRLVLDLFRPDKIRYRISDRDICEALWMKQDSDEIPRPFAGDDDGFVWQLDTDTYTKDSVAYITTITTVPTNFSYIDPSLATRIKNGQFLELVYEPLFPTTVDVTVTWDNRLTQNLTFTLDSSGATLGEFLIDTDALGASGFTSQVKRLTGSGKYASVSFSNNTDTGTFSINKAFMYCTLGAE